METKVRPNIDQAMCNHARILMAGGATTGMAAELLGIGKSTVQKMRQAGFNAGKYQQMKQQEKEKAAKATVELVYDQSIAEQYRKEQAAKAEEQVPGQMQMELPVKKETDEPERIRWMKFIAAQVDKMIFQQAQQYDMVHMELDRINDTLSQLVRAIRKE